MYISAVSDVVFSLRAHNTFADEINQYTCSVYAFQMGTRRRPIDFTSIEDVTAPFEFSSESWNMPWTTPHKMLLLVMLHILLCRNRQSHSAFRLGLLLICIPKSWRRSKATTLSPDLWSSLQDDNQFLGYAMEWNGWSTWRTHVQSWIQSYFICFYHSKKNLNLFLFFCRAEIPCLTHFNRYKKVC